MKTLIISLLVLAITSVSIAQNVTIPDLNFKNALLSIGVDADGNGEISYAEAEAITVMDVSRYSIENMTGIEAFINLKELNCDGNQLTSVNVSNNTVLEVLQLEFNQLSTLDVSNNIALRRLDCDYNDLNSLDVSHNIALIKLDCNSNNLTSLNLSNNVALVELRCWENQLTSLDITNTVSLIILYCQANELTTLDVSDNIALESFNCASNNLTSLDVANNINLLQLSCYDNNLTILDVSNNTALTYLHCGSTNLSILDVSNNTALTNLSCGNNNLTILDVSNNTALTNLSCGDNNLTILDVSNNTALTHLYCFRNALNILDVRNSNNHSLWQFYATENNLTCISVDDETADHSHWHVDPGVIFSNDCAFAGFNRGLVLLHDLSGSMSWSFNGDYNPPEHHKRISIAKDAAKFFLDLIYVQALEEVQLGFAEFPRHPWSYFVGCNGKILEDIKPFDDTYYNYARNILIPGFQSDGNTPLLAGLETASDMFTDNTINYRSVILFSDGYHNCPGTVSSGDEALEVLIGNLITRNIKVSTIGFGRAEDVDESILSDIATGTGGCYYPVTGPGFNPDLWEGEPEEIPDLVLKDVYKNILIEDLGLTGITDPIITIKSGEVLTIPVTVCEADRHITFFVTWALPGHDRVRLGLKSSDSKPVPGAGVNILKSETHTIISVPESFLALPEKIGVNPWQIILEADSVSDPDGFKCMYGVIAGSRVKMELEKDKEIYSTGEEIILTTCVKEGNTVLKELEGVTALLSFPEVGKGNWYVSNFSRSIFAYPLDSIAFSELQNPMQIAARYISDIKGKKFPFRTKVTDIKFTDDGTNGDMLADDGIYTAVFKNTGVEGSYMFHVTARGHTTNGIPFSRELKISPRVKVGVVSDHIGIVIKEELIKDKTSKLFKIIVTPMDNQGNYHGPGHASTISINLSKGEAIGNVTDHLNGSYSREFLIKSSDNPRKIKVSVVVDEVAHSRELVEPILNCRIIVYLLIIIFMIVVILQFAICKRRLRKNQL